MRRVVGGVKWWQVRGINGYACFPFTSILIIERDSVDGQWITAKKDWREAKRRHKSQRKQKDSATQPPLDSDNPKQSDASVYEQSMDEMRCILYLHGGVYIDVLWNYYSLGLGGYYFGSVDQERSVDKIMGVLHSFDILYRYSIQRLARKINGRVFGT